MINYNIPLSVARYVWREEDSNARDMFEAMRDEGDSSHHGDRIRIIHEDCLDRVLAEELENDEYILGCFNASFLASVCDLSEEIITALQEAEKFEAIGKYLIDNDCLTGPHGLAAAYAAADGYGHHFAAYDGEQQELAKDWYAFRTN